MSLTLPGWLPLRSKGSRREQLDLETCKARLEARPKRGKLNEAEADAARLALLSRLRSSSWRFGQDLRGTAGTLIVAAAGFLLVVGIGVATSYVGVPPEATGSGDTISSSPSRSGSNGEMLARLTDYTRSIGTEESASMAAAGKLLPDVNTMIERLAARLVTTPGDIEGWRMLGWSYFRTARYEQAATAYARAVELDPSSAELKLSYEDAKAKAAESGNSEIASSLQNEAVGTNANAPSVEKLTQSESVPPPAHDAMRPIDGRWPGRSPKEFSARRGGLDFAYALSSCAGGERGRGNNVPQGA